jgi:flagellar motor component MotA
MDIATGLGLIAGAIVLVTLILMGGDLRMFLDAHAAIVIFGGSFAATLIRFPLSSIFHGLPLGARFAFTMRRITQRDLVDEIAGRSGSRRSRSRTRSWPRASASSPTATTTTSFATTSSATAITS